MSDVGARKEDGVLDLDGLTDMTLVADGRGAADIAIRADLAVVADDDVSLDDDARQDLGALADLEPPVDIERGMRPGLLSVMLTSGHGLDIGPQEVPGVDDREGLSCLEVTATVFSGQQDDALGGGQRAVRGVSDEGRQFRRREPSCGMNGEIRILADGFGQARGQQDGQLVSAQADVGQGEIT